MATKEELLRRKRELLLQKKAMMEQGQKETSVLDAVLDTPFHNVPQFPSLRELGKAVLNVPGDALKVAEGFTGAIPALAQFIGSGADPVPAAKSMASGVVDFAQGKDTPQADTVEELASSFLKPKETLINEPVRFALDVSTLGPLARIGRFAKTASTPGIIEKAADAVSPVTALQRATSSSAGQALQKGAGEFTASLMGAITNAKGLSLKKSFEAGKAGGRVLDALKAARKGEISAQRVASEVVDAFEDLVAQRSVAYRQQLPNVKLKDSNRSLDMVEVMNDVIKEIDIPIKEVKDGRPVLDFSKTRFQGSPAKQEQIQNSLNMIANNIQNQDDFRAIDALKQALDENIVWKDDAMASKASNEIVKKMRRRVRDELGEKLDGYDKLTGDFEEATKDLLEIRESLALNSKPEVIARNIKNALFLENTPERIGRIKALEKIEEASDNPILTKAAGFVTNPGFKEGLTSSALRSLMFGGAGFGLAGGGVTGASIPVAVAAMSLTSPRLVGRLAQSMGTSTRRAQQLVDFLRDKTPAGISDNITLGAALAAHRQNQQELPANASFVQRLGRVQQ